MKNGTKIGPNRRADGAGDQAEGDDRQRNGLGEGDEQQHRPVDQVGQDRPRVGLHEVLGQRRRSAGRCCRTRALPERDWKYAVWSVIRLLNETPMPGIGLS